MASFNAHVELVRQNTSLLDGMLIPAVQQHPDWVVTVAFYTALHMVEAMLFDDFPDKHTSHHSERHNVLQGARYSHIWYDYRPLYAQSRLARYLQTAAGKDIASFASYSRPNTIVPNFIDGHLAKVRQETEQVIRQSRPTFTFILPAATVPPSSPAIPPSAAAGS